MFIMNIKITLVWLFIVGINISGYAQKDTTKQQTIDITSIYKPVIRSTPKVNFSATYLTADTTKNIATYTIPALNLFYKYQPVTLKPLALNKDTVLDLGSKNFIKIGYGNLSSPFATASLSIGDGIKSLVNLSANYNAFKGGIVNQEFAQLNAKLSGSIFTQSNEVFGSFGMNQQDYHLYGYDHSFINFSKQAVLQQFKDLQWMVGIRNKMSNDLGIHYEPTVQFSIFNNQLKFRENSVRIEIPVEKSIGDIFSLRFSVKTDFNSNTSNSLVGNIHFNNTIFQLSPELIYHSNSILFHGGFSPAWDDGKLVVLPNFYGEAKVNNQSLLLQAGYVGQIISNSYRNLSFINPYLHSFSLQRNTQEKEWYVGFKSTAGNHFSFSAKASLINYNNLPLYINDTSKDYKEFLICYESNITNLRFHADMSYVTSNQLTITSGITYNGYNDLKVNPKAWGTIPLEFVTSIRWRASSQLQLKTDCKLFSGGPYLLKNNIQKTLSNGADLSVGGEFSINNKISAWVDANNLFNNKYERWHNYPVFGIHVAGGIIIKF